VTTWGSIETITSRAVMAWLWLKSSLWPCFDCTPKTMNATCPAGRAVVEIALSPNPILGPW
jgi:hypothetical protein